MSEVKYRYVGPDKFYGIPARDLTEDEFEQLQVNQKRDVIANASYKEVEAKKKQDDKKGDGDSK